jgi:hypothetical protein
LKNYSRFTSVTLDPTILNHGGRRWTRIKNEECRAPLDSWKGVWFMTNRNSGTAFAPQLRRDETAVGSGDLGGFVIF